MVEPTSTDDLATTSEHASSAVVPQKVIEDLVEAIRDLRHAVDPVANLSLRRIVNCLAQGA